MAWIAGAKLVDVAHFGFHRMAGRARQEVASVFVERRTLAAEIATDKCAVDDDILLVHTNRARHLLTQGERSFVCRDNVRFAVIVEPGRARVRLHVALMMPRRPERVLEDAMRICKCTLA